MRTRLQSFCLTALLLLVGQSLFAHDFYVDGIYYTYLSQADKTVSVSYQGSSFNEYSNEYTGNVVIPSSVTYNGTTYSVTSIGSSAFFYCTGLTSVEIPSSVTSIGYEAFYGCTGVTSVEIPSSVTSIGNYAFYECTGLTNVEVPSCVTSIGSSAFYHVKNIIYSGSAEGSPWGALTVNGIFDGDFVYSDAEKTQLTSYIGSGGEMLFQAV